MNSDRISTPQKSLQINLDATKHGTFAEIGAGQEVARWFFHVGGAAGTVAKTISAYDMAVSDAIYGPSDRYVSRHRLQAMLDHEYELLLQQLDQKRGTTTSFFVFADTIATRSYSRHEEGRGWMGLRFRHKPREDPSQVIIHVRMLDTENALQQEALGLLGVNLIYGALYHYHEPNALIGSLMDDLTRERIEIEMIKFSGHCFADVDNRLMSLQLVEQNFTDASMFTDKEEIVQPAEVLYKKSVLVQRGTFRPITHLAKDMLDRASKQFISESSKAEGRPLVVTEMSLRNLLTGDRIDHSDFLARVDILGMLGKTVMISNFARYFPLVAYLRRYTPRSIAFTMGIPNLRELFEEKYYSDLRGGTLEGLGRLFDDHVKLYVYPYKDPATGNLITVGNMSIAPKLQHLYAYLQENQQIKAIDDVDESQLYISPRDVLAKIQGGDPSWERLVPSQAVQLIKDGKYFGYQPSEESAPPR